MHPPDDNCASSWIAPAVFLLQLRVTYDLPDNASLNVHFERPSSTLSVLFKVE